MVCVTWGIARINIHNMVHKNNVLISMEMLSQSHKTNPSFKMKMTQPFLKERDGRNEGRRTICTQKWLYDNCVCCSLQSHTTHSTTEAKLGERKALPVSTYQLLSEFISTTNNKIYTACVLMSPVLKHRDCMHVARPWGWGRGVGMGIRVRLVLGHGVRVLSHLGFFPWEIQVCVLFSGES